MTDPFIGEVKMVAFDYPPRYWAFCNGQRLEISQNQSLYSLLGTLYGGEGIVDFLLPDLRGRTPIGVGTSQYFGTNYATGQKSGWSDVPLTPAELPSHNHIVRAKTEADPTLDPTTPYADQNMADGNIPASIALKHLGPFSNDTSTLTDLSPNAVGSVGSGSAHTNTQPSLAVHFCISLQGLYPSRN